MRPRASLRGVLAVGGLLVLAAMFASLGAWQLERADESRAAAAQFAAGADAPPLTAPPAELASELRFRRIELRGEYLSGPQFLLDNMVHDGVAGYHVLTPLAVRGDRWLLVNRGWVPVGPRRDVLPEVSERAPAQTVRGRLERLPRPALRLSAGADPPAAAPLAVVSYPTAAELAGRLGVPLYDYQLLLDPMEPNGFLRDWHAPGLGPERHVVYAGQWLLLAAGAAGAAVVLVVKALRRDGGGARAA